MKSKLTKDDIIAEVINLRLKNLFSTKSILEYLEKEHGFGKTQQYEYLKWAREVIKEQYSQLNPAALEEVIAQYEEQMEKIKDNVKLWNELKKELNKLQGLYAPERHEVTITDFKSKFPGIDINKPSDDGQH